jgi:hypothetical protein
MVRIVVTADNFCLVAAKFYDDIGATDQEFQEDLRRFSLLKRLFNTYLKSGELKDRLVLNHLIILFNVFNEATIPLLFHELREYLPQLVPFLVGMQRLPDKVGDQFTSEIPLDTKVIECLRRSLQAQ